MNFHKIKRFFDPPQVADESLARTANLLNISMLWMSTAGVVVVLLYLFFPVGINTNIIYPVAVGAVVTASILLLKFFFLNRGNIQETGWIMVTIIFVALTISLFLFGGIRDENISWLFFIIAISGLLLGERGALLFGGLSILYAITLFVFEKNGLVSDSIEPVLGVYNFLPVVINLVVLLIFIYTAVRQTRISLQQVQSHRQALQQSNESLQKEIIERKRTEIALLEANQTIVHAHDNLEQQVTVRTAELVAANEHLEELLYAITHDLKEPLRSIEFFSDRVRDQYQEILDAHAQDYLMRIHQASKRQRDLLDTIAILAELTQGVRIPEKPIALETAVSTVLRKLKDRIDETKADIQVKTPLPQVYVKSRWANIAIYNLIENGLKYPQHGSHPQIEICSYSGSKGIGLAIKDRGPGIPKESVQKMFKLFQRGVGRDIAGTGAGLTIARQIARTHGGDCWVFTREDGGSIFYIAFNHKVHE